MKYAGEVGGVTGDNANRAFAVERLEMRKQLAVNLQIRLHSKSYPHELIHFVGRADCERCRTHLRYGQIGTLPECEAANGFAFKRLVLGQRASNRGNIA